MRLSPVPPEPERPGGTSTSGSPEAVLLRRCAGGDQTAYAELYDRIAPRVFGLVRRVVHNRELSEEVTQEVLIEVWRNSARFDTTRGSAMGWILAITHRRAVDRVRSEEAAGRRDTTYWQSSRGEAADPTGEAAEIDLDRERVRRALDSLTDTQRRSIELAYYGGYTHTEIAALLDIPVGTAKTRIRDGLIRLRDTMGGGAR